MRDVMMNLSEGSQLDRDPTRLSVFVIASDSPNSIRWMTLAFVVTNQGITGHRRQSPRNQSHCALALADIQSLTLGPPTLLCSRDRNMRNLLIYLSALSSLSYDVRALHHSAAQLRDLMAYPKYEVSFLTELPLSASDADKAKVLGVEREEEWLNAKLLLGEKRRLSDGSTKVPTEVSVLPIQHLAHRADLPQRSAWRFSR